MKLLYQHYMKNPKNWRLARYSAPLRPGRAAKGPPKHPDSTTYSKVIRTYLELSSHLYIYGGLHLLGGLLNPMRIPLHDFIHQVSEVNICEAQDDFPRKVSSHMDCSSLPQATNP